jgi:U3 small nucleolar RNA-associated protein 20
MEKWQTLNLTEEFNDFKKSLRGIIIITLPQVIHHQDKVINALLLSIQSATTLSLQPLLE